MIRRQVVVPAPPEDVWDALVDADRSEAWMGGRLEVSELSPGAPLEFRSGDGSTWEGRVDTVRAGRYLRFQWRKVAGKSGPRPESGERGERRASDEAAASGEPSLVSEVSYLLEPDSRGGTCLTVQEREVAAGPTASASAPVAVQASVGWTAADDSGFSAWARTQGRALALAGR
jgi:uncharacterized protein YndB with AHSA1/START domain